jgi:hypothetical protein
MESTSLCAIGSSSSSHSPSLWRALPLIGPKRKGAPTRVSVVGSSSIREGYLTAQGRDESQETQLEDVFGGGQLATASPTCETEDAGNLDEEMGLPDLISPKDDSDTEGDDEHRRNLGSPDISSDRT